MEVAVATEMLDRCNAEGSYMSVDSDVSGFIIIIIIIVIVCLGLRSRIFCIVELVVLLLLPRLFLFVFFLVLMPYFPFRFCFLLR